MRVRRVILLSFFVGVLAPGYVLAQSPVTYHLHKEASTTGQGQYQLKTAGPDAAAFLLQSSDLRQITGSWIVATFDTQVGTPGVAGTIPGGTTATATLWMRKTVSTGRFNPKILLFRNNSSGALLCTGIGTGELTLTVTAYTVNCPINNSVFLNSTDRLFLWVGVNIVQSANKSVRADLDIEGTLNGNYDSRIVVPGIVPAPAIANLDPNSGPVNWPVTIAGTNFGTSGTVAFNGTAATPTNWSATSISTAVPAGATTGSVVVTVGGAPSNGVTFTVIPPPTLTSITPPTAHITDPVTIAGNNFLTSKGSSTVTFNGTPATPTSWTNTSIGVPVPAGATSGNVVVTVSGQASNSLPFTVIPAPTIVSAAPPTGHLGESVVITGTNFGPTQGSNTVGFNGVAAAPTNWSDTSITAPVPAGATSGNIVVTVSNQPSNGFPFTVILPGTIAGTITRVTGGSAISGATVQALETGVVRGSATTAGDGTYSIANLDPDTYEVRVFATGFSSELRQGITVTSSTTTTVNVPMYLPGAVSGRVTQADGVTPLARAAVTVYEGPVQKGSASTNGTGDYTVGELRPGGYTVQAANVGYTTVEQGAAITESATTIRNFSLSTAPSGPVLYAYDELGRLVQVTDPGGESAIYRYDPVGNILAIERPGGTGVAISAFTPTSGLMGATVTIWGTGFASTPNQNTVAFNGTAATVSTATGTQLVVTAPAGATTGAIAVTTPTGSAISPEPFTVLTTNGAPTITDFTPTTAASGTALTVNGSHFDTVAGNNNLRLNISPAPVSSATGAALQATVPATATTGRVTVATQNGTAVSSGYLWIAPPPYAATDPISTTLMTFGTAAPVSVPTANKIALLAFEGTEGHRASVSIMNNTGGTSAVALYDPLAAVVRSTPVLSSAFLDTVSLRSTATYSIVFDPGTTNPTSASLTVYDVPADFSGTIAPGGSTTVAIGTPGQNGAATFTGTAAQRIFLEGTNGTIAGQIFGCDVNVSIVSVADNATVAPATCMEGSGFVDTTTLPITGTYRIAVDPVDWATGNLPLTLYNVPGDDSGSVTINGPGHALTMNAVGQNGFVTFPGTQGQTARVHISGNTVNGFLDVSLVQILPGGGETVLTSASGLSSQFDLPTQTLPATGTYKVVVSPRGTATGVATVSVLDP